MSFRMMVEGEFIWRSAGSPSCHILSPAAGLNMTFWILVRKTSEVRRRFETSGGKQRVRINLKVK